MKRSLQNGRYLSEQVTCDVSAMWPFGGVGRYRINVFVTELNSGPHSVMRPLPSGATREYAFDSY
jgi:hypothetical protein